MSTVQELYDRNIQEENFALLVAARVNEIRSGNATVLEFERVGGVFYTVEQEHLMFADKIARAVCAYLDTGDTK